MIESGSNTSRRRPQVWLARMRQRDACWVLEVTLKFELKGSRIESKAAVSCAIIACSRLQFLQEGTKIIAQLFYTWFHMQLLHATIAHETAPLSDCL